MDNPSDVQILERVLNRHGRSWQAVKTELGGACGLKMVTIAGCVLREFIVNETLEQRMIEFFSLLPSDAAIMDVLPGSFIYPAMAGTPLGIKYIDAYQFAVGSKEWTALEHCAVITRLEIWITENKMHLVW